MKVGFIYTSPFPAKRGFSAADRRVRDLVRGLQKAGVDISLLVPKYHFSASASSNNEEFPIEYLGGFVIGNLKVINRLFFWFSAVKFVKRNKLDTIILYNTQADSVLFSYYLKSLKVNIVTEICDLHSDADKMTFRSKLAGWTERKLAKISDLVITISDLLKNVIVTHNPQARVVKIPILVDTDFFNNASVVSRTNFNFDIPNKDSFLISYVGGLWHHQGVRYLMQAFKLVVNANFNAKLLIAGNYNASPNCDDVFSIAKELELEDHVIFPGWVDTDTVKQILDMSSLLVISQTNHKFAQAGLPTKLAEYAACGKPILITDVGDVTNYFTDGVNCLICAPSDAHSMFEKIKYLIENPSLATLLGTNAKTIALTRFDYKVNGKLLKEELLRI